MSEQEKYERMLQEYNPDALIPYGYAAAIVGVRFRKGVMVAAISRQRCIEIIQEVNPKTPRDEAAEYVDFNMVDAHFGPNDPVWLD